MKHLLAVLLVTTCNLSCSGGGIPENKRLTIIGPFDAASFPTEEECAHLEELEIADAFVSKIPQRNFTFMTGLRILRLRNCSITCLKKVHSRLKTAWANLAELDLTDNNLTTIDLETLAAFPNVKRLILKRNNLALITGGVCGSLELLDLEGNQITDLSVFSGTTFPNLTTLILDKNKIKGLNWPLYNEMPALKTLSLAGNEITIPEGKCDVVNRSVTELDVCDNPFTRICSPEQDAAATALCKAAFPNAKLKSDCCIQ